MAREATKWAYKTDFAKSCPDMTAPALALLRALCWFYEVRNELLRKPFNLAHF